MEHPGDDACEVPRDCFYRTKALLFVNRTFKLSQDGMRLLNTEVGSSLKEMREVILLTPKLFYPNRNMLAFTRTSPSRTLPQVIGNGSRYATSLLILDCVCLRSQTNHSISQTTPDVCFYLLPKGFHKKNT